MDSQPTSKRRSACYRAPAWCVQARGPLVGGYRSSWYPSLLMCVTHLRFMEGGPSPVKAHGPSRHAGPSVPCVQRRSL
jgi:hypothetical protein